MINFVKFWICHIIDIYDIIIYWFPPADDYMIAKISYLIIILNYKAREINIVNR